MSGEFLEGYMHLYISIHIFNLNINHSVQIWFVFVSRMTHLPSWWSCRVTYSFIYLLWLSMEHHQLGSIDAPTHSKACLLWARITVRSSPGFEPPGFEPPRVWAPQGLSPQGLSPPGFEPPRVWAPQGLSPVFFLAIASSALYHRAVKEVKMRMVIGKDYFSAWCTQWKHACHVTKRISHMTPNRKRSRQTVTTRSHYCHLVLPTCGPKPIMKTSL